eukprot:TRINITY_DN75313_c0_g1_i1.p1 TRINITY_DN75313_c0_g1~~TRINITY_DN75313_c0_g1_i1.p1  ORF type:complete len:1038 (+),score=202.89 TRINITY_DN75313_c0_g1_i1:206-3319(+)
MEALAKAYEMVAFHPMAQEIYLACFFLLGFILFRTEAMQKILGGGAQGKTLDSGRVACTAQELQGLLSERRYEQVLDCWPMLKNFTPESLSAVVTALLALDRPNDVGLFMAKAAVNLPHLRPSFHKTIEAIVAPACQVPRQRVLIALQDVFAQASDSLDSHAKVALLSGFAKMNDEKYVVEALAECRNLVSSQVLAGVATAFLTAKNLPMALHYLEKVLGMTGGSGSEDIIVQLACAGTENAIAEQAGSDEATSRSITSDLLDVLERFGFQHVDSLCEILVSVTRQGRCNAAMAKRLEGLLRAALAKGDALPLHAYSSLVRVYSTSTGKAKNIFDEMVWFYPKPPESLLPSLLSACLSPVNCGLADHIYSWARDHQLCDVELFSALIKVLTVGKQPQLICTKLEQALHDGLSLNLGASLQGLLVRVAVQSGRLDLARRAFAEGSHEASSYALLIKALSQSGHSDEAMELLTSMRKAHPDGTLDTAVGNALLHACVSAGKEQEACEVFQHMRGCKSVDQVSYNIFMKLNVGGSGSSKEVHALLQEMQQHGFHENTSSYNSILNGAIAKGDFDKAWQTLEEMEQKGVAIDAYTVSIMFKGYKSHRQAINHTIFNRSLSLISKHCIKLDDVLADVILEVCGTLRDIACLNNVLATLKKHGWNIQRLRSPSTAAALIKAYSSTNQISKARQLWDEVAQTRAFEPSRAMYGQMIDALVGSRGFDEALKLFEQMKMMHSGRFDCQSFAIAYATIIKGYAQQKDCAKALNVYSEMKANRVTVGIVVLNTLLDACCRVGDVGRASKIFDDIKQHGLQPDLISYSTLIKGYCVKCELEEALQLFGEMRRRGIKPDAIVFNSLLDGCARKEMPSLCEQVVNDMVEAGVKPSNHSASILIKLYGRIQDLDAAFRVLDEMPEKYGFRPNPAVYTTLMSSCTWNGRLDLAMNLRLRMREEGQQADEKTYSTLLRGTLKAGSCESMVALMREALDEEAVVGRYLLEEDMIQNCLQMAKRRKCWESQGLDELVGKLTAAGYRVSSSRSNNRR